MGSPAQAALSVIGEPADTEATAPIPLYVARVGLCMLKDRIGDDPKEGVKKVIDSLGRDSRVKELVPIDLEKASFQKPSFSVGGVDEPAEFSSGVPISPSIHLHALEVKPPLQFSVQVPRRVQANSSSEASVPSDEYWVTWNGVLLVVLWRFEGANSFGSLGGIFVIEILKDAAKRAGKSIYTQPCGPNCGYPFAHRNIVMAATEGANADDLGSFKEIDRWSAAVRLGIDSTDPLAAARSLYSEVRLAAHWFARMRSDGRAMADIEKSARKDLRDLLGIYHSRTSIGSVINPKSWLIRWKMHGWRRNSTRLITRLWLALAALESRRHDWANTKFGYENVARFKERGLVFQREYNDEVNYVSAIEVTSIESAVRYAASRLDTRSVVVATAIGAIAGAIIGATVGGLLQVANSSNTTGTASTPSPPAHSATVSPTP